MVDKYLMKMRAGKNLYYYGARYYDPRISLWLSVDPLQEKHPNVSSYAYCSLNPVKYIDSDGMDDYRFDKKSGTFHIVNSTNDNTDRVLATYGKGQVKLKGQNWLSRLFTKKSEIGKPKVTLDNIEKGILKDGMDVKTKDNFFKVSDSDPTLPSQKEWKLCS